MKLTNETVEQAVAQVWETGDYFVRKGRDGYGGGGLRRIVRVGSDFIVVAIDTYQTMTYADARNATEAMENYIRVNGEVAKVVINEIKFEEVTQ